MTLARELAIEREPEILRPHHGALEVRLGVLSPPGRGRDGPEDDAHVRPSARTVHARGNGGRHHGEVTLPEAQLLERAASRECDSGDAHAEEELAVADDGLAGSAVQARH